MTRCHSISAIIAVTQTLINKARRWGVSWLGSRNGGEGGEKKRNDERREGGGEVSARQEVVEKKGNGGIPQEWKE